MQEDLAKFLEAIASTPMENYLSDYGKSLIMRARLRNMGLTDEDIDKLNRLGIFKEPV